MTAKQYLKQVKDLNYIIENEIQELESLIRLSESIKNPTLSINKTKSSNIKNDFSTLIAKIVDKEEIIQENINYKVDLIQKIRKEINDMPNKTYSIILIEKYLYFKTIEQIAEKLGYTKRHIVRLHRESLNEFYKMHKKTIKDF